MADSILRKIGRDRLDNFAPLVTVADGHRFAIETMRVLRRYGEGGVRPWRWSVDTDCRPKGKPHDNVIFECMERLRAVGTGHATRGFLAVMTDFVGVQLMGEFEPSIEDYERLLKKRLARCRGRARHKDGDLGL